MFNELISKLTGSSSSKKQTEESGGSDGSRLFSRATAAAKRRELYAEWLQASSQSKEGSELDCRTRTTIEQEMHPPAPLETPGSLRNAIADRTRYEQRDSKSQEAYNRYISNNPITGSGEHAPVPVTTVKQAKEFYREQSAKISAADGGGHAEYAPLLPQSQSLSLGSTDSNPSAIPIVQGELNVAGTADAIREREAKLVAEIDQYEFRLKMAELENQEEKAKELRAWLLKVASQTYTPSKAMRRLAQSRYAQVRTSIASNSRVPIDVMWLLGRDSSHEVRAAVAKCLDCPLELLQLLAADGHTVVSATAKETLKQLGAAWTSGHALSA